ncbi:glycosyltransferase family 4 protein [Halalkalibacterium halodurans]|uniref:BH3712 protein n=1 Tax=Halalkalibacterium halodurans (strain ATCC BAA-125 / DSM 18197 / FERM 7344 / JCM 9153 / C-125) TaxID=272558 RepID=Q9K6L7_HALH5|nr:glycosyltransferase family 4 protein [Halalkalibacterium halodurans]MED4170867.1 glycosyltransferase family 4 protein [Halalkalibacterium halodurans]BAB07431.1 BH3712 [Halalkalibacterium halodurans C-125]
MGSKRNIAIICYKYPPEYSGYGKQLKSVISKMNNDHLNYKLTILTAFKSSKTEANTFLDIVPLGTDFTQKKSIVFYVFCLRVLLWLILNRKKYSIIHCIKAGPEAVVANIVSKLLDKRLIVKVAQDELSDREVKEATSLKKVSRISRQILLRTVDNFIAISEEIDHNLQKRVSKKSKIIKIPNGVDDKRFAPVDCTTKRAIRRNLELPVERVLILFAGAINKRKGIVDLLDAVQKVKTKNHYSLVICGPILEDINFEERVQEINKTNKKIKIIYKGVVTDIEKYMAASDIFVLPSYSEGLPNVLLEAGSTGLALITTDIGGSRDIVIDGRNGFVIPTNSSDLLAKKMELLIDNEDIRERMGDETRSVIENNFSLEFVAKEYEYLYSKLFCENKKK